MRQRRAEKREAYRVHNTPIVTPSDNLDRRDYRPYVGQVVSDIAAGDVGDVALEVGDSTGETVPAENVHDVTLETGLRVMLLRMPISDYLVPVPFDYSSCDEPISPEPIPLSP